MGKIILARLMSGQLVIAEKTNAGMKYPVIVIVDSSGRGALLMDFFGGISKGGREDSRKVELPSDTIIPGSEVEPLKEMEDKYIEMKTGITVPKKKIIQAAHKNIN